MFAAVTEVHVNNVSGSCAAGARFTVFNKSRNFYEAVGFCAARGSTLARIGNANEHLRVIDLVLASNFSSNFGRYFWIGKIHSCLIITTMSPRSC